MKKKTAVIILAFLAVCLCSCSKSKNDSGIDSEYVKTESVVTEESTEETTEVRGAAVSYTHLDVYKRQYRGRACGL